jgi:RNA recognition motif-containing protein
MLNSYPKDAITGEELLVNPAQTTDQPLQFLLASHAMSFGNEFTIVGYPDSQVMTMQVNLSDPDFTNTGDDFPNVGLINSADKASMMRSKYKLLQF